MEKKSYHVAATNRRKRPADAPKAPNQSITAPDTQTPPASPETQDNAASAAVPVMMIAPELYTWLAEYGAAHGGQTPGELTARALIGYLDRMAAQPSLSAGEKAFQKICGHYRDVVLSEIDACDFSPEQEADARKKAAVFSSLFENPKTPPYVLRYFFDNAEPEFSQKIGRELDALNVVYETLIPDAPPEPLA